MAKVELNAVEEAKWHVANCLRAIEGCIDFRQMPSYQKMLADWQQRLAYAEFTGCDYLEMMQA